MTLSIAGTDLVLQLFRGGVIPDLYSHEAQADYLQSIHR